MHAHKHTHTHTHERGGDSRTAAVRHCVILLLLSLLCSDFVHGFLYGASVPLVGHRNWERKHCVSETGTRRRGGCRAGTADRHSPQPYVLLASSVCAASLAAEVPIR